MIGLLVYLALLVVRARAAASAGRAARARARRRRGGVRGAPGPHDDVRGVPRGPADLGAARRRHGPRARAAVREPAPSARVRRTRASLVVAALRGAGAGRRAARPDVSELRRLLPPGLGPRAARRRQADVRRLRGADRAPAVPRVCALLGLRRRPTPTACSCSSACCRSSRSSGAPSGVGRGVFGPWPGLVGAAFSPVELRAPALRRARVRRRAVPGDRPVGGGARGRARRARGVLVMALLAVAGLLRPEAWVLAGAYWLWCGVAADRPARARRRRAADVGPRRPAGSPGDPLFSLHATSDLADELNRERGLRHVPGSFVSFLVDAARPPVALAGARRARARAGGCAGARAARPARAASAPAS